MSQATVKIARKSMCKVTIEGTGKNLTAQAGLIPAMKFLGKLGFRDTFHKVVQHTRASNARYQMETFNHVMRGRVWKRARAFTSRLMRESMWIDVDSTVKTVYGKKLEGAEVGYNSHKRGAASYNPQLAFCAATKEILQGWMRITPRTRVSRLY